MKTRWIAAAVLAGQLAAQPAYAWDEIGHEVIARIAWASMSPEARAAAAALLSNAPEDSGLLALNPATGAEVNRRRIFFVEASTWPDVVRDEAFPQRRRAYHRGNWHYVNYFFESTPEGPRDRPDVRPDSVNVVERLARLEASVVDLKRSSAERAVDLAWILHLVGDVHQPLHTTARITPSAPRGDLGGNLFLMNGTVNLHSYWDGSIKRSFRRKAGESEQTYVSRIATALMQQHPRSEFAGPRLDALSAAEWAQEGFGTAKSQVYATPEGQAPSAAYREATAATAEQAAALAGYRLARMLNRLFAPTAADAPAPAAP